LAKSITAALIKIYVIAHLNFVYICSVSKFRQWRVASVEFILFMSKLELKYYRSTRAMHINGNFAFAN